MPSPLLLAAPAAVVFALLRDHQLQAPGPGRAELEAQIYAKLTDIERRFTQWLIENESVSHLIFDQPRRHFPRIRDAMIEAVGADLIGAGGTRAVLSVAPSESAQGAHPGFVLKLSRSGNWGHKDNEREVEVWDWVATHAGTNPLASELTQTLVPVLMHAEDYSWLVMDRASPLNLKVPWPEQAQMEGRVEYMESLGLMDLYRHNLGMHDGQVKAFDYGLHNLELE